MKFTMARDRIVRTKYGHSFQFKKGVPLAIPDHIIPDIVAAGGVPEEDIDEEVVKSGEPIDPAEREALLIAAFEEIVLKNERGSFTAAGVPHGKVVAQIVGFNAHPKEREAAWTKFQTQGEE